MTVLIGLLLLAAYFIKSLNAEVLILSVIAALGGAALLAYYYYSKQNYWKIILANNGFIFIHKNLPSENHIDTFYADLIACRNDYLLSSYGQIDKNLDYAEQLKNLQWLKRLSAISPAEFESKYNLLQKTISPDKREVGFGK